MNLNGMKFLENSFESKYVCRNCDLSILKNSKISRYRYVQYWRISLIMHKLPCRHILKYQWMRRLHFMLTRYIQSLYRAK